MMQLDTNLLRETGQITVHGFIFTGNVTYCYRLKAQSLGTDVWCACLIFCLPSYSCI